MKSPAFILLIGLVCLNSIHLLQAQTAYFWNGGDISASPAAGGTGTWSNTNSWRIDTNTGTQGTWAAGAGGTNAAILAGTAGTITLGTSGSANFTGSSLNANTSGYIITSTSNSRNLVMTGGLTLADNVTLTINQNSTGQNWGFGSLSLGSNALLTVEGIATANNANRINLTGGTTSGGGSISLAGTAAGPTGFVSNSGASSLNSNIFNNSGTSATMLGANSGNTLIYGGVLSGSANLQFSAGQAGGAGVVTMSNVSDYTGNTYSNTGTNAVVRIGVNNALPTTTTYFFGASAGGGTADTGGSLDLNGFDLVLGGLEAAISTRGVANNTATLSTLTIGKATGTNTFGGVIGTVANTNLTTQSANIAVIKTGDSTQIFTSANTYTGGTSINQGTLVINTTTGSGTGTGDVTVATNGTLAGIGIINPTDDNYIYINGTLQVGDPTASSPTQSSLTLNTGGTGSTIVGSTGFFMLDIFGGAGSGILNPLTDVDTVKLFGDMSITSGATLALYNPNSISGFGLGDSWQLFDGGSIVGNFNIDDSALGYDTASYVGSFNSSTGIYSIGVIPEPSRAALLLLGLLGIIARRRR